MITKLKSLCKNVWQEFSSQINTSDIIFILILLIFTLLRSYNITQSLNFQNDIGRDYLRLIEWKRSGKPPLLGPQNSAIPFNQSAVYFYMFYPLFIITNMSFLTTFLTSLALHLAVLIVGYIFLRNSRHQELKPVLLFILALATVHPQLIGQQRYIWNPSFVWLSTTSAFFFYYLLIKQFKTQNKINHNWLWLFAFSLSFAVAMNLSAAPALIAFLLIALFHFKKQVWKLVGAVFVAGNVWFLPYWAFEVRYKFQILKRVLGQQFLVLNESSLTLSTKIENLAQYLLSFDLNWAQLLIAGAILATATIIFKFKRKFQVFTQVGWLAFVLLSLTLGISLLAPVAMESHYIFPFLAFLFLMLAGIKINFVKYGLTALLIFIWLQPAQIKSYFQPAARTYQQLETCFEKVCAQQKQPIFVSVQAQHKYHNGPEFRYLMIKHGCQVKHIETEANQAEQMAVVVDQSQYTHGKTSYDELSLFGQAKEEKVYHCPGDVQVHILSRQ